MQVIKPAAMSTTRSSTENLQSLQQPDCSPIFLQCWGQFLPQNMKYIWQFFFTSFVHLLIPIERCSTYSNYGGTLITWPPTSAHKTTHHSVTDKCYIYKELSSVLLKLLSLLYHISQHLHSSLTSR